MHTFLAYTEHVFKFKLVRDRTAVCPLYLEKIRRLAHFVLQGNASMKLQSLLLELLPHRVKVQFMDKETCS